MNEVLERFVGETQAQFSGRLKRPADIFRRTSSSEELLDISILGGYSIADISSNKVSPHDIDPKILEAFHQQYPHAGDFVGFIRSHSGDSEAINGIVSGIKGKLFEREYLDWLNHGHIPEGAIAELASSPTQEGWDIIIKDTSGHPIEYLQLKATESIGYIREALAAHPEIDVVATHEIFSRIDELDNAHLGGHVIDGDLLNDHLQEHVQSGIDAAELTPEFHIPLLAFGMIAVQSVKNYAEGKATKEQALRSGIKRGWRVLACRAAAFASILISHEPVVGLPTSVLTRFGFSRYDTQKQGSALLQGLTAATVERRSSLSAASQ
jgi:hypothetical protein